MTKYAAPLDSLAKILTIVIFIIVIIPLSQVLYSAVNGYPEMWLIFAVLVISLGLSLLYRPLYYTLDAEGLHIHRKMGIVTIPYNDIQQARSITKKELGFGIRTFGVGGFFGYFGKYMYKEMGHATLYVTDMSKLVLIQTARKNILVSPDPKDEFLKELVHALRK